MKQIIALTLVASSMLAFSSCDEKAKLADAVAGSWTGNAERVMTPGQPTTTTVTRTYAFLPDLNSSTGGELQATAQFSVESGTQLQAAGTQPIAVTINGTATIKGRWEAVDDDEIIVSFDSKTLEVTVDPQEVLLEYNIVDETSQPVESPVAPDIAKTVEQSMKRVLLHSVFNFAKIDDIKINGNLMSCEVAKVDYTLRKDM